MTKKKKKGMYDLTAREYSKDQPDADLKRSFWHGSRELWRTARQVILEAVNQDGTFLDVGCASGALLRDLRAWAGQRGFTLIPYGIDIIEELIIESKQNNPGFEPNFFAADNKIFKPHIDFTYICMNFPDACEKSADKDKIVKKYLGYLKPQGRLILTLYDDRLTEIPRAQHFCRDRGGKLGFIFAGQALVKDLTAVFWLEK